MPGGAAAAADIVLTMLTNSDAVEAAMAGPDGALGAMSGNAIWVQMSTIGIAGTERAAQLAHDAGVTLVDAPVSGTKEPAEQGKLIVLASGPESALDICEPVFEAIGQKTVRVGAEPGRGSAFKLVLNAWLVELVESLAETIAFAQALGFEPELFLETITGGALDSPYAQSKGKEMARGEFPTSFPLRHAHKDAGLVAQEAEQRGLDLPAIRAALAQLDRALEARPRRPGCRRGLRGRTSRSRATGVEPARGRGLDAGRPLRRIDLELSWSERDLPERVRTKHVHRLHPYLGKFIPQLVEALLERYVPRRTRARPVRRLRDDARAGARVRARRHRHRHRRVQLPADAREDARVQPRSSSSASCATRCAARRSRRRSRRGRPRYVRDWFAPRPPRSSSSSGGWSRTTSTRTCCASCWRARRGPRGARRISTSTSRARRSASEYWCHKHRGRAARRAGAPLPAPLHARHTRPDREFARVRARGAARGPARRRARARLRRALRRRRHLAALSGADRLPRAAPLRVRAARPRRVPRARARRAGAGTSRAALAAYCEGIAAVFVNVRARRCSRARRW